MAIEKEIGTVYKCDNLGDVKPKIVIGGSGAKFVPNLNVSFLCGAASEKCYINVNRKSVVVGNEKESLAVSALSLKVGTETDIWTIDADGNLKWDIDIESLPASNVYEWEIKTSNNIIFERQDALTIEQVARGMWRPENVIGSYSVYVDKKGHYKDRNGNTLVNYKTGKIAHIYRPLCIDADGKIAWAELWIEKNTLRVTIPQKFLDTARYPVKLDPTFGYTSIGASQFTIDDSYLLAAVGAAFTYTASAGDTITQFSIYGRATSGGLTTAAYAMSAGLPTSRLAAEVSITLGTSNAWNHSAAVSQAMSNGVTYCEALHNTANNAVTVFYDSFSNSTSYATGSSLPATWSHGGYDSWHYSMYPTYTAGGGQTISVSDSGAASDVLGIGAVLAIAESGQGSDVFGLGAALGLADVGSGADIIAQLLAQLAVNDTGAAADVLAELGANVPVSDVGAGTDSSLIAATFIITDSGSGSDAISVLQAILIAISDAATATDALSISANIFSTDNGQGTDAIVLSVNLSVTDTGSAIDAVSILTEVLKTVADLAMASDSVGAISVNLAVGDSGSGLDLLSALGVVAQIVDYASGLDVVIRIIDGETKTISITFVGKRPAMTFTSKHPEILFSGKQAKINFTGGLS